MVFLGLAMLAAFYPEEGVQIGVAHLDYPSLYSVLGETEVEAEMDSVPMEPEVQQLSPEELMEQRMAEVDAARDSEFVTFCMKNPTRIHMPDDDLTYLDAVFEALDEAGSRHVRIMHYGDSQLEGDRITGVFREKLQSSFGGSGTGLLPAVQTIGMATARVEHTPSLPNYKFFGSASFHAEHNQYGPLAQVAQVDTAATFTVTAIGGSTYPHCRSFNKVGLAMMGSGDCTVSFGDSELPMTCPLDSSYGGLRIFSASLPRSVSKVEIRVKGHMKVFGVMIDGQRGVSMDNIGMRGASGTFFTGIDRSSFAPFFQQQNVRLIILQFGGNSIPYLKPGRSLSGYKRQIKSQIEYFKRIAPKARIIFIGPSDMATNVEDEMKTYPVLPMTVDSLRVAALESGVAFWDMFRSMGGRGSMVKWVESDPQLAGEDYIHFTPRGARRISELFYGAFDLYYKYYRFRCHPEDRTEEEADTIK